LLTKNIEIKYEIKTRIKAEYRHYHALIKFLKSTAVSLKTRLTIYQTIIFL
jgi:hypothetical protein